ncbi:hypothetical protein [Neisseria leonii]|uniref:hypothetical protein n=1 Tax=Neisseria leonii TaxID=2995413 RepID=UPI00237B6CCB|nr:hypothetical protein [Neisseria sp. 3986]MDD9324723.1 hypothetical protein [Neisseria sp. 3986]
MDRAQRRAAKYQKAQPAKTYRLHKAVLIPPKTVLMQVAFTQIEHPHDRIRELAQDVEIMHRLNEKREVVPV